MYKKYKLAKTLPKDSVMEIRASELIMMVEEIDRLKRNVIVHPTWLNTGCPDHDIPRCQCCCDDWYTSQLETMVENA